MSRFGVTFAMMFAAWLAFTFSSARNELIVGLLASLAVAWLSKKFALDDVRGLKQAHLRLFEAVKFALYFFYAEVTSHVNVAKAVITGKISPAVLRLDACAKSPSGKTFLSGAITLTPGTLSVDVRDSEIYLHYLDSSGGQDTEKKLAAFSGNIFG